MDPDIEKLDVQIKSEVNYDELDYYVPEEAIVVSSEAYEEVVVSEDMITKHKMEPEDTYYDSNYSFNSPSKDTYYDSAYDENNNSNNYLYNQIREPQQNYSLKAKQLELMRVKKMGGKQKLVSGRADSWSHCRDDAFNIDDVTVMGYRNKTNKPRKRSFAHRLQWNNRDMEEAMRGVGLQNMTIRGAAKKYNVPYSTLKDRIKGRVTHGTKPGVKTVLSPEEETQLVWFIHQMEQCGFSLLCTDVRQKASELLSMTQRNCKNPVVPGHNWLSGFLKRHPGLEIKRSSSRLHPPSSNKIKLMLKKFYDILANAYNKLTNDIEKLAPDRVYVMNVIQLQALSKATIVTTACANGSLLPPYVIGPFSRQTLYHMQQTYPMAYFVTSTDLDSRDKILLPWFRDYLISKIRGTNPHHNNVLLLDQPVGYISINLAELASESGIKIVSIPPQLSKLLQPLDTTFYASFQNATQKQLTWVNNNQECTDDDGVQIAHVLKRVFDRASIFAIEIMSNFKQTGIYPHNPRAIPVEKLASLQPHSSTSSAFGSIIDDDDDDDGGSYNSNIVTSRDAIVTVKNGMEEDLFNNSNPNNCFLRQEVVSLEDHGLHLLSELSSRTAHTTNNHNDQDHKYKGDKSYQRYDKKKYLTEEVVYSYDGSYGNPDDVQYVAHEVSLENKDNYDDDEEEEEEDEEDEDEGVSNKRPKRSAAGRSERLMKRIMEDKDEEEDDEVVRKYRKKAKFLLDDEYKYHKRHHDDDEEEEDDDDELYDDGQCCRSRPIDRKYRVHRGSVEGGELYDVVDRFSDGWKEQENSFKSTPSKYEKPSYYYNNTTNNNNTPVKSIINNNFIRQQPQQHVRHFSVTRGRLKNSAMRQQKIINKHNNSNNDDHNNSDINLAIQSILPPTNNNTKFIVKEEEEERRNGGMMVDSPLRNVKLADVKGTRLLYSLKYQQPSSHDSVTEEVVENDNPMRMLLNNNTSSTSLLSPPSSLPSSLVVSSSASSPSLSSQPHSRLILSPKNAGHNHLKRTIVIQSSLNNNNDNKNNNTNNNNSSNNNNVNSNINIVNNVTSNNNANKTTTTTNLLTKTFKSPSQRIIIKPPNNNALNISGDVKETEEGMVEIGGKAYDWSRKVRATKHIMVSGVEVELVRNVTLRDALSRGDLKDNNLEII